METLNAGGLWPFFHFCVCGALSSVCVCVHTTTLATLIILQHSHRHAATKRQL